MKITIPEDGNIIIESEIFEERLEFDCENAPLLSSRIITLLTENAVTRDEDEYPEDGSRIIRFVEVAEHDLS